MKFEREKDVPALCGKSWQDRVALRRLACRRDPSIKGLSVFSVFLAWWCFPLADWALKRLGSDSSFLLFFAVSIPLMILVEWLFHALLIAPRVRKALEGHEP